MENGKETICHIISPYGAVAVECKVLPRYDAGQETIYV